MGSDLFINHSLRIMNFSYRVLGIDLTNFFVNNSVGNVFTSGETVKTLLSDINQLEKKNISSIANYALEGLASMDPAKIDEFYEFM